MGGINMAEWVITEEMAQKIINTEPITLKPLDAQHDFFLSKKEQVAHAKQILETWHKQNNR